MTKKLLKNTLAEDDRITAGIINDPDTFEASDAQFAAARRGRPVLPENKRKRSVTMLMDPDIIAFFKEGGRGWQTRVHDVLRHHVRRAAPRAD